MVQGIGVILQQWAEMDIFFYVLPFLLIFALVFAILQKVQLMGAGAGKDPDGYTHNRGVSAIIAVCVGLLALQFDSVPVFFSIIFPKLGIGLSIMLVILIFAGYFIDFKTKQAGILFFGVGGVIALIIVMTSFVDYSWWTGGFWQDNLSAIVAGIIILVFVGVVVGTGGKGNDPKHINWLYRDIAPGP
ncbi:MAG: hypothetical protein WC796_01635 [Candidatus Pacearchaeota archaeon]|jgi:hypothetical protein